MFCLCTRTVQRVSVYVFIVLNSSLFSAHFTLTTSDKQNISGNVHGHAKSPTPSHPAPLTFRSVIHAQRRKDPLSSSHAFPYYTIFILTCCSLVVTSKLFSNKMLVELDLKKIVHWLKTHASEFLGTTTNYLVIVMTWCQDLSSTVVTIPYGKIFDSTFVTVFIYYWIMPSTAYIT